jgi:hypothetical protein
VTLPSAVTMARVFLNVQIQPIVIPVHYQVAHMRIVGSFRILLRVDVTEERVRTVVIHGSGIQMMLNVHLANRVALKVESTIV